MLYLNVFKTSLKGVYDLSRNNAKDDILNTVINILDEKEDIDKITTREIARRANVNCALINYYFNSKQELVRQAVELCMQKIIDDVYQKSINEKISAVDKLILMIKQISEFSAHNYYLSKLAIEHEMLLGNINTSKIIIPILNEIYDNQKNEYELKLISLQVLTPIQVLFLNHEKYIKYLFIDLNEKQRRNQILEKLVLNIILKNKENEDDFTWRIRPNHLKP